MKTDKAEKIAADNDAFRSTLQMPVFGVPPVPGRFLLTQGIRAFEPVEQIEICAAVRDFKAFSPDNDPYSERDFGAFDYAGQKVFWKIDYYNNTLDGGSEDPSDPAKTARVLTIMLAQEY